MKKSKKKEYVKQDVEEMSDEQDEANEEEKGQEEEQDLNALSPEEFMKLRQAKFGQRAVNDADAIKQRLYEVKKSFYNRLESVRLIKKQGRIPFTEHMAVTAEDPLQSADAMLNSNKAEKLGLSALEINDDIKREIAFHNVTRQNVQNGMRILIQARVPISRPDDFLAEMLKTDEHMLKVKGRLLKQQNKMQKFEEKRAKQENKKFHKAIKSFTQAKRHQEKRDNMNAIDELKKAVREKQGDVGEKEFDRIMKKSASRQGLDPEKGKRTHRKESVMDQVRGGKRDKSGAGGPESGSPSYPTARRGEEGRVGEGRFNRSFA